MLKEFSSYGQNTTQLTTALQGARARTHTQTRARARELLLSSSQKLRTPVVIITEENRTSTDSQQQHNSDQSTLSLHSQLVLNVSDNEHSCDDSLT